MRPWLPLDAPNRICSALLRGVVYLRAVDNMATGRLRSAQSQVNSIPCGWASPGSKRLTLSDMRVPDELSKGQEDDPPDRMLLQGAYADKFIRVGDAYQATAVPNCSLW